MSFSEHTLGIKIQNKFVAIESCNPFGELSKYDFVYTDFVSSDRNHNTCYGSKITNIISGDNFFILNGWKLLSLSFPGDWFGNWTHLDLEDRFGKKIKHYVPVDKAVYADSYKHLIREGLLEAVRFTEDTPCVDYFEMLEGFKPIKGRLSIEEFHKLVESIDAYITKYFDLKKKLNNEDISFDADKLKSSVSDNISKLFGLSVNVD